MLSTMLFISARFTVLRSVVKGQKKQFRQTALLEQKGGLEQLIFTAEELYKDVRGIEWKENNKEIVINGIYHEVISIERINGNYVVNIIEDKKENELFKNFFEKTDDKGQLASCIMMALGMNFVVSTPLEFKQQCAIMIDHRTPFTLKEGKGFCARTRIPPRG